MADFSLQGLGISSEEFLGSMFAPHEIVRLRVLSDRPNADFTGQKLEVEQGKFSNIMGTLHRHNAENRGVFFAVNYSENGGHTDADITRINAQFAEIDNIPLEEQLAKVKEFPLPPSLVIKTRKSLHCYWLMKNADVGRFRYIQRQLVAHFGADPACVNESRVLRLPEFYHCKQEPLMVECIKFNPELRYKQEQLSEHLTSVPEEASAAAKSAHSAKAGMQGSQKGLVLIGRKCEFFKHCRRYAKSLPEPQWHGMITNVAVFEGGVEAIHSISKPHPDYTFEATQKKIETFYKSGTRPMTCQTIAERGFKCPKLDSCGGKCKSPAGLAFFAMDISEIRKWLEKTKTATNTLDNVVIARQFINDYAYNVDLGLAHALITSEMKTKFSFKVSDLEPIIAFHKEIHKAFLETHQVKFDRAGDELPQWYEFTDKGRIRFMPSVLANYCVENENVFYCGDNYYFYQNGVYVQRDEMAAQQRIRHHMAIDKHKTYSQISDAERQWRIEICKTVREINVNHYIMNFKNGLYYVHADELKEHNPDVLSTIQLNANYGGSEKANCPVFLKYLDDVLPKTEHALVQEMLGYI
jgi:putative DNA primase/helicase